MINWKGVLAGLLGLAILPAAATADDYPSQPIELIVPFSPGGSTDLSARIFAKGLQDKLGVPVRVNNITGGQTLPAVEHVNNANPDGYTLLLDGQSQTVLLEIVVGNLPFDIMDRTYVGETVRLSNILFVHPDSPIKSLKQVVETLKADPAKLSWGSLGGTSLSDVGFANLLVAAGVKEEQTRPAVFKGGSQIAVQVAGGHIDLGIASPTSLKKYVEAGKLRPLAILGKERNNLYPDTPTSAEEGYPGVLAIQWNGISGPPGMSEDIARKLHATLQEMYKDEAFVAELTKVGLDTYPSEYGDMKKLVEAERDNFSMLKK